MRQKFFCLIMLSIIGLAVWSQPDYDITRYDESSGLPQVHATQILQDEDGFIWLSTWNGLCRFDGYEFLRMASQAGDGCNMSNDRIRDIWLTDKGNLYCKIDDGLYLFDTHTYRFSDITSDKERQRAQQLWKDSSKRGHFNGKFIEFTDRQGQRWELRGDAVYCLRPVIKPAQPIAQLQPAQIRCLARDRQKRIWITTKEDANVQLFDAQLKPIGYLRRDGSIQSQYASFGVAVYCIHQTSDGTIWLGTKTDGLFRFNENQKTILHIDSLPHQSIYDIKEDRWGRLWLATLGGGIICYDDKKHSTRQYFPSLKARYIHITPDDVLLATSTEGLLVGQISQDIQNVAFHRHLREGNRESSLSCNATMDIIQDEQGHLFVSTESGGVCEITSRRLTTDTLSFRRLPIKGGWPTDVALSLTDLGNGLLVCSNSMLIVYNKEKAEGNVLDAWYFSHPYRFSEVRPILLDDKRWLIGTMEGAFTLHPQDIIRKPFVPYIALTGISIQNGASNFAVNHLDTLCLSPLERSLTIQFAALDYTNTQRIRYSFRFGNDATPWNIIGHDHSVTLLDLKPGTYQLWLRSTNADGQWVDNLRHLTIIVQPTFWETTWAKILIIALILAVLVAIVYISLYIRHIKRQQRETLEKYLALIPTPTVNSVIVNSPHINKTSDTLDPVLERVMDFIDHHLSDSDIGVGDMASAAATSRSGLQRKLKQAMGITPQDLLREARIKRACQLLRTTDKTIAEVAYACGFTDPKYFSRCFKKLTGRRPSEYSTSN